MKAAKQPWYFTEKGFWAMAIGVLGLVVVGSLMFGCAKPLVKPSVAVAAVEAEIEKAVEPFAGSAVEKRNGRYHRIGFGETLWGITAKEMGDPFLWPLVWRHNRDFIPEPDWIEAGEVLDIPVDEAGVIESNEWAHGVSAKWPRKGYARGEHPGKRP